LQLSSANRHPARVADLLVAAGVVVFLIDAVFIEAFVDFPDGQRAAGVGNVRHSVTSHRPERKI
jgi:hypothetical protein